VDVAGEHDRVGRLALPQEPEDAVAVGRVAVPGVAPPGAAGTWVQVQLGHDHLLGEHVPAGLGAVQAVQQPAPLVAAEDGAAGVDPLRAGDHPAPAGVLVARLVVAVLAGVEQVELDQVAKRSRRNNGMVGPRGGRRSGMCSQQAR
jgi:hypothetical protein